MTKPTTVDDYICQAPVPTQAKLREMRACLSAVAPEATETLKWGQPAFVAEYILFVYAGFKNHISLHPTESVIEALAKDVHQYKTSDNTLQFPLDKPLPLELIGTVATLRVKESKAGVKWK